MLALELLSKSLDLRGKESGVPSFPDIRSLIGLSLERLFLVAVLKIHQDCVLLGVNSYVGEVYVAVGQVLVVVKVINGKCDLVEDLLDELVVDIGELLTDQSLKVTLERLLVTHESLVL